MNEEEKYVMVKIEMIFFGKSPSAAVVKECTMRRKVQSIASFFIVICIIFGMSSGCTDKVDPTLSDRKESEAEATAQTETQTEKQTEVQTEIKETTVDETLPEETASVDSVPSGADEPVVSSVDYIGVPEKHQLMKETIFRKIPQDALMQKGMIVVNDVWVINGKLYIFGETDKNKGMLISCDPDFSNVKVADEWYLNGGSRVGCAVGGDEAVYLLKKTVHNAVSPDQYWTWQLIRREEGEPQWAMDVGCQWAESVHCVGNRVMVFARDGLWIYNADGELVKTDKFWEEQETRGAVQAVPLDENRMLLVFSGAYGNYLREINLETGEIVDYEWPFWWEPRYHCQTGYGYDVFITMNSAVVGYNLGDLTYTEVMDCTASGLESAYYNIFPLDDGRFFSVQSGLNVREMFVLEPESPENIENRIVVTMGGYYVADKVEGPGYGVLRETVDKFNANNDTYYLKLDDRFLVYSGREHWYEKKQKVLVEAIKRGDVPDILIWEDGTYSFAEGLENWLEDLYPWIDQDTELSQDDFYENMLKAYSIDGKLCQITPSLVIRSMAGRRSVIGDVQSWTIADLENLMSEYPVLVPGSDRPKDQYRDYDVTSKSSYLLTLIDLAGERFFDVSNGQCNFETEEFVRWLKLCGEETVKRVGQDLNVDSSDQKKLFGSQGVSWLSSFTYTEANYGEEIVFVGAPDEDGYGSVVSGILPVGIYTQSEMKEGAWEVIRFLLSEQYQKDIQWSLPIRKDCIEERAAEAEVSEDAPVIELIKTVNRKEFFNDEMKDIVRESSERYFAGEISAEVAAKLIQERMDRYLRSFEKETESGKQRVQTGKEGIVRRIPYGETVSVDLDSDGALEKLTVMTVEGAENIRRPIVLINGNVFDREYVERLTGELVNLDRTYFYLVDIDTKDAWIEIALFTQGENDCPETTFLRYHEGGLLSIGSVATGPPLIDSGEVKLMSSGDGRIVGKSRVDIVEKAWIIREWYLVNGQDGSGEFVEEPARFYTFYPIRDLDEYLVVTQELPAYSQMDKNSEVTVLPVGTQVVPYCIYPQTGWLRCSCIGRQEVWLKLDENGWLDPIGINEDSLSQYIEGLRVDES